MKRLGLWPGFAIAQIIKMPYSPFINSTEFPYHITNRCINREWFLLPLDQVWNIVSESLSFTAQAFNLKVHAFILMSNHYHLIVTSPEGNLSAAMNYFQADVAKKIVKDASRINHLWARRFKRCEIKRDHYFRNAYKYLYRNPVTAGICKRIEDYPFSTLHGLIGSRRLEIPTFDPFLFDSPEFILSWMNTSPKSEELDSIRKALRRKTFALPTFQGKIHPLEDSLI